MSAIDTLVRRHGLTTCLLLPPLVFLAAFFVVPLIEVVRGSFFAPDLTFDHYARMASEPLYLRVVSITLKIALLTVLLCVLLGYAAAYLIATASPRARQLLMLCVIVPFFLSTLIRNYIWMAILQRSGLLNHALRDLGLITEPLALMYNQTGVVVVMVNMLLPFTIFPILSSLLAISPDLYHASSSLGAGPIRTFCRVTLPMSLPGVVAGALLVFIVSLGFFITPALVGGQKEMMISNLIDFHIRQVLNWPFAFALANVLLCGTLVLYFLYARSVEGRLPRTAFP
ncbi:MAG: ABC transporter permease [Alphaproteobacteria bacterium]|nr:ABC transporter permease [Alphaproteobacteria bacterium]